MRRASSSTVCGSETTGNLREVGVGRAAGPRRSSRSSSPGKSVDLNSAVKADTSSTFRDDQLERDLLYRIFQPTAGR
jgi:hypothetical protein